MKMKVFLAFHCVTTKKNLSVIMKKMLLRNQIYKVKIEEVLSQQIINYNLFVDQ